MPPRRRITGSNLSAAGARTAPGRCGGVSHCQPGPAYCSDDDGVRRDRNIRTRKKPPKSTVTISRKLPNASEGPDATSAPRFGPAASPAMGLNQRDAPKPRRCWLARNSLRRGRWRGGTRALGARRRRRRRWAPRLPPPPRRLLQRDRRPQRPTARRGTGQSRGILFINNLLCQVRSEPGINAHTVPPIWSRAAQRSYPVNMGQRYRRSGCGIRPCRSRPVPSSASSFPGPGHRESTRP